VHESYFETFQPFIRRRCAEEHGTVLRAPRQRMRVPAIALALCYLTFCLLAPGCGGKNQLTLGSHITSDGLPPVEASLAPKIYDADSIVDKKCEETVAGYANCKEHLHAVAERDLADKYLKEFSLFIDQQQTKQGETSFEIGSHYESVYKSVQEGLHIAKSYKTPIMLVNKEENPHYVIRSMAIKADVDRAICTYLINRDEAEDSIIKVCKDLLKQTPSLSNAERLKLEKEMAEYSVRLWEQTQKRQ